MANAPAAPRKDDSPNVNRHLRGYVEAEGVLKVLSRYVIPIGIIIAGIVLIVIAHGHYKSVFADRRSLESAVGVAFVLIGISVWLFNYLMRMSVESGYDRDREDDARDYFREHGEWPDWYQ